MAQGNSDAVCAPVGGFAVLGGENAPSERLRCTKVEAERLTKVQSLNCL